MANPVPILRVRNWDRYQHYKDRRPVWIKLYTSSDDYAYSQLTLAERGLLHELWKLAGRTDNTIPYDAKWIARAAQISERIDLKVLIEQGFIEVDSDPLAIRKQDAIPEKETEVEKRKIFRQNTREQIAAVWLSHSPPLIGHRHEYFTAPDVRSRIDQAVDRYDVAAVVTAIQLYAEVLASPTHFYTYSHPFRDFLTAKNLDRFVPEAVPLENFRIRENGSSRRVSTDDLLSAYREEQ